jgi:hypothetical protein
MSSELIMQSNMSAAVVNMINGTLLTESDTLTITSTRTGDGLIRGNIRRLHPFTTGVAYAFEGPANTITFSAVSNVSDIIVHIDEENINDFPFGASITRMYDIHVPVGTYTATLRLHYEDDELNGNDEAALALWHYDGSAWGNVGRTANDVTVNYIEHSGLTDITNRWTASGAPNLVQWNGSVSSDWNTAANWTVLAGAASAPPTATDIVDLGTDLFVNQPTISSSVTVKNIVFGSAQAVTLTLGSGGSLTTLGDIGGNWTGNAIHTINVNNESLTVNGNINLSDGTTGHAINLNIGTGTVTTALNLIQSGGANISFSGAGTLHIYENFVRTSGTFTAGTGTVIYNGSENQNVANVNYYNLTISKSAGLAATNGGLNITGDLLIAAGQFENYSSATVGRNVTIDMGATFRDYSNLHVQGNWNNNGTYVPINSNIFFDGSSTQTVSASVFNNFNVDKPVGSSVVLTGDIVINGNLTVTSGTLNIKSFNCNRSVQGGTATLADSSTIILSANNPPANFSNYAVANSSTVIFDGTGAQTLYLPGISLGHLVLRNAGLKTLVSPLALNGNLTIENGAFFDAGANTITLNGNWQNDGTFIPQSSTVVCNGIGKNIIGNTTFDKVTVPGSYTVLNDVIFNDLLNITSTGSISGGGTVHVTMNGDLINSGILYTLGTTTFTGNVLQTLSLINAVQTVAITVNFNGTVSPVLNSTSPPQYGYLNINNTGGINASVGYTILYALNIGSGASFNGGAFSHTLYGSLTNNGTITSSGTLSFLPATAKTLNFGTGFSSTGRVYFGGAGAITLAGTPVSFNNVNINNTNAAGVTPSSAWTIAKDLRIVSGSLFNAGTYTHTVGGNILNSGTLNPGTSTFVLNGSGVQDVSSTSAFNNLTINKPAGAVTQTSNVTVNNVLNFISGSIRTGANVLIQPSSGTLTGAAQSTGWVAGNLRKNIATGATAQIFEVGDTTGYTPVDMTFASVTTAGSLTASAISGDHPAISSSPINALKSVNRYWKLTNSGIVFTSYSSVFHYLASDIDAGAATSSFGAGLYNGSSWVLPAVTAPTTTSIGMMGATAIGDVAIGEVCYAGTTISYPASPYCSSAGIVSVTRAGAAGGTYTSTGGLTLNSGTGAITLGTSTAGTYTVTYTIAATGGCRQYSTSATITITTQPFADGYYAGNPYCSNGGIAFPTGSAAGASGTLSSTAGLSIDPSNGVIYLGASTPGNYTVTYTVPPSGGCATYTNTTTIAITPMPSATISYAAGTYCLGSGIVSVTRSGTPGGTYHAVAGLSVNASTGAINTAASSAGNYQVTYTVAAAQGCEEYSTTASVTLTTPPSAVISYSGSPFCNLPGTAPVSFSGTAGGVFSAPAGLVLNATTGSINLGASTPGTYSVTYTVSASGGCSLYAISTPVTIAVPGTWTGTVSTEWNESGNWLCGALPSATTSVILPAGLSLYPVLTSGTDAIYNLTIQNGASLTLAGAVLQLSGTLSGGGSLVATSGTLELNGTVAQTLPAGIFGGNTIPDLTINNPAGVTLGGALSVSDVLTITNGSLATGGYLTLSSTATTTARVAPITSSAANPVSGGVTVERYLPGRRKYRLLTAPVTTSTAAVLTAGQEGLSIWGNWQNSGSNATPNAGTIITGGTLADGFDPQTPNASLFTYNDVNRTFTSFSSTTGKNTKYTPLTAGRAYYMFVMVIVPIPSPPPHRTLLRYVPKEPC